MQIYVARQPIFDSKLRVFGYEILHRSSSANYYAETDGDRASSEVISHSLLLFGLDRLTRGRRAFINFTTRLLEEEVALLLPRDQVVVEVLESVHPGEALLAACRGLKEAGYLLALDDICHHRDCSPLLELADIVKVDFLQARGHERRAIMEQIDRPEVIYLAEKVETEKDLAEAMEMGYTYFQGYFFSKPQMMSQRDVAAFKLTYLHVLQEMSKPEIDYQQVENLFKNDFSLSYKLLKLINSAAFGFRSQITSIRQALTLLGQRELIKWFSLLALKTMGADKPDELIVTAVCRARFCELLAPRLQLKQRSAELYLLGLFSLVDAIMDQPLDLILADLPLAPDIKSALLGDTGLMADLYGLILAYEKGNFAAAAILARKLALDDQEMAAIYVQALDQANQIFA